MSHYVLVADEENEEPIELPLEEDGTLLLTTLIAQFAGACGLKYRNPETNTWRGIRLADGRMYASDNSWAGHTYVTVYPKEKRKAEVLENPLAKTKRVEKKCSDLIVLGLPWKSSEDDLRQYFSQFGELLMVQVKRDVRTKQSKGFGFIRFRDYESQMKALSQRHLIEGRWCDIRIPNSQEGSQMELNQKVYVGRCSEDMTDADLRTYFSQFGEVTDVFLPKPFRAFAFVTFADPEVAHNLCGDDHIIRGTSVHVSCATPKNAERFPEYNSAGATAGGGGGQWQNYSGRGGGGHAGSGSWQGAAGRGRGSTNRGHAMGSTMMAAGDFGQQAQANLYPPGAFPLNPAMVAAAQVALMGMMNQQGGLGVPTPDHSGQPGTQGAPPFGSPVAGTVAPGQGQNFAGGAGWGNAPNVADMSGTAWNQQKSSGPGWS